MKRHNRIRIQNEMLVFEGWQFIHFDLAAGLEGVVLKRNLRQHLGCKNMLGLAL